MDSIDLLEKLFQQLDLIKSQLDNAMQLRSDIMAVTKKSQEKLQLALLREPKNSDEIAEIKARLEKELHLSINCELYIIKLQAESIATELEIKRLEGRMQEVLNKEGFFKVRTKKKVDPNHDKSHSLNTACQLGSG